MDKNKILLIIAFFSIYVFWGSTYLLNKIVVSELPPLMLSSIRFVIAGGLIFCIALVLKIPILISRKQFINSLIAAFFFLAYGNGTIVWALQYVDSGFASLEASTQPIVILILMRLFYGIKIKTKSIIGVVLGILGIYLLVSQKRIVVEAASVFTFHASKCAKFRKKRLLSFFSS